MVKINPTAVEAQREVELAQVRGERGQAILAELDADLKAIEKANAAELKALVTRMLERQRVMAVVLRRLVD